MNMCSFSGVSLQLNGMMKWPRYKDTGAVGHCRRVCVCTARHWMEGYKQKWLPLWNLEWYFVQLAASDLGELSFLLHKKLACLTTNKAQSTSVDHPKSIWISKIHRFIFKFIRELYKAHIRFFITSLLGTAAVGWFCIQLLPSSVIKCVYIFISEAGSHCLLYITTHWWVELDQLLKNHISDVLVEGTR